MATDPRLNNPRYVEYYNEQYFELKKKRASGTATSAEIQQIQEIEKFFEGSPYFKKDQNNRAVNTDRTGTETSWKDIYTYDDTEPQTRRNDIAPSPPHPSTNANQNETVKKLNETTKKPGQGILFYPQALENVGPSTYSIDPEAPRHALKVTILDYFGSNLESKEQKAQASDSSNFNIGSTSRSIQETADQLRSNRLTQQALNNLQNDKNFVTTQSIAAGVGLIGGLLSGNVAPAVTAVGAVTKFITRSQTKINKEILPDDVKSIVYLYANGSNLDYTYKTTWSVTETTGMVTDLANAIETARSTGEFSENMLESVKASVSRLIQASDNNIGNLFLSKLGSAPARNFEFLFDQVQRRNFTVNVTFQPRNEREIDSAAKIIQTFKHYSHPSRPKDSPMMKVPTAFILENLTYTENQGWIENLYLPRYKVCVLQGMNVNYGQNGHLVTHFDFVKSNAGGAFKAPVKFEMSLAFQEIQILTREDITAPDEFFKSNPRTGYY